MISLTYMDIAMLLGLGFAIGMPTGGWIEYEALRRALRSEKTK